MHNFIEKFFPIQVIPLRLHYEKLLVKYSSLSLYTKFTDIVVVQCAFFFCNHTYLRTIKSKGKPMFVKKTF